MEKLCETAMMLLILSDMALLAVSLLSTAIRLVAFQGVLLAVFIILIQWSDLTLRIGLIALVSMGIKGVLFPYLLRRALRNAGIQREVEPFIGYIPSLLVGVLFFGVALFVHDKISIHIGPGLPLVVPAAFLTILTGLFLIAARKKALTQCLGYIVFENGIYAFGVAAAGEIPALVELGILLDAFVAVLVMSVAIYRINRTFLHMDADQLSELKG